MIAKITKGADPAGLAVYLHGPGTAEEHVYDRRPGGAVIGGNLCLEGARDGAQWALELRQAAAVRRDIARPTWHASLRNPEQDRTLSDAEWADAAQVFAQRLGFAEHPWVAVRHGVDHVHLAVSRVNHDGSVWAARHDFRAAQAACVELERAHGLTVAPRMSTPATKRSADHQVSAGEWRRAQREAEPPPRVVLAERVRAAVDVGSGRGREGFDAALRAVGVAFRVNVAGTGRVAGYSFALPAHVDEAGAPVWFKASQLDRSLAWSKVAPLLDATRAEPVVEVARKLLETKGRHAERTGAAITAAQEEALRADLGRIPGVAARSVEQDSAWWSARHRELGAAARAIAAGVKGQRDALEAQRLARISFPPPTRERLTLAEVRRVAREASERSYSDRRRGEDHDRGGPERGRGFSR